MKQENTQPLWKVLNEKRTQGEWKAENGHGLNEYLVCTPEMYIATVLAIDIPDEEGQANAEYTAIAVNNLHILAEALEKAREALRKLDLIDKTFTAEGAIDTVNEALNRIS